MIKKIYFTLFIILSIFLSTSSHAEIRIKEFGGIMYVENATVKELEEIFSQYKYKRFRALDDNAYPAIFVKTLPTDFKEITSQKYRNELFIRILAPLALKINEEIKNERYTLLRIEEAYTKTQKLTEKETEKLEFLSKKYDYFTRMTGDSRINLQLQNLKLRIEQVPPSILISAAAMESNWGYSRPALLANCLYKEKVWNTTEGLEPLEDKDDGYRFKIFDSLIEAMRSYALTFNSHLNYSSIWYTRQLSIERQKGLPLGESIAYALSTASNLPNYSGILTYTTAFYDLFAIDIGQLKRKETK
jgi:uncharacterized FlgJ-related protein